MTKRIWCCANRLYRQTTLAAIVVFLILSAIQAYKPLNLDNADLPVWAEAVAHTGKPIAYRSELRPTDAFVYHTPLYLYALGTWFKLFGVGASQIRMFGAVCAVLLGWICLQFIQTLFGTQHHRRVGVFFWPLFLLNPYTLQVSAIADIDSTIYGPLLCGFMLVVIRLHWRNGTQCASEPGLLPLAVCGIVLAFCFWAKLTTAILLLPFPFLVLLFHSTWPRSIRAGAAVVGLGIGLFAITYWIWCRWMGVSPTEVLGWLSSYPSSGQPGFANRVAAHYATFSFMAPFIMKWTGVTPWIAAITVGFCCLRRAKLRDQPAYLLGLVICVALCSTAAYAAIRMTYGNSPYKYAYVFWGVIALALATLAGSGGRGLPAPCSGQDVDRSRPGPSAALVFTAAATAVVAFVGAFAFIQDGAIRASFFSKYMLVTVAPPVLAVVVGVGAWLAKHLEIASAAVLLMTVAQIGAAAGVATFQVQQEYSTTYNYGQTGLEETAAYLRATSDPSDFIMCMKDLGPMTGRRYYESYGFIYGGEAGGTDAIRILKDKTRFAVFTEQIGEDQLIMNSTLLSWVQSNCRIVKKIGNYRIYTCSQ